MTEGNRPDFEVFAIKEREGGGKDLLIKIGVAFQRRNAEGMTIMLDALPFGRKLAVLPPLPHQAESHSPGKVRRQFVRSETPS
jgi:hypothetical protein